MLPHIYCVNLATSTKRRERMERRFQHHGLMDRVTFVEAVSRDDPIIDQKYQGMDTHEQTDRKWRSGMGCFLGHLKAVRTFVETSQDDGALICEDDIMLHNDFARKFIEGWSAIPANPTLVTLSYMMTSWDGAEKISESVYTVSPKNTWGAQMYWIARSYAIQVLEIYDRPFKILDEEKLFRSSEAIIRSSGGYMMYPPLVIEDGIDSERAPEDLPFHHRHFSWWGYENFSSAEIDNSCPFAT